MVGIPSVLVPLPSAIDDHQTANAASLASVGGAWPMPQPTFTPEALAARLTELLDRYGADTVEEAIGTLRKSAAQQMRAKIAAIPDGVYEGSSQVDSDGVVDEPLTIRMKVTKKGEELTFDYATCDCSDYDEFTCLCGEPTCRGVVTGSDWRKPELQARYVGWFSPYLVRKIAALPAI